MALKSTRDQKKTAGDAKPAKSHGEIAAKDLEKVTGGTSASGLPTGKRNHIVYSNDPCDGGE